MNDRLLDPTRATAGTLLISVTGRDRPGVTSALFAAISSYGGADPVDPVDVVDLEQIVLRGRLILGILVTSPADPQPLIDAIRDVADSLGMQVEIETGAGDNPRRPQGRSRVTVLGTPLSAAAVAAVAARITGSGANIDRIVRLARYPVTAIEFAVSGSDIEGLRALLGAEAAAQQVDIAVQRADLIQRGARLIVMDVDSTLIQGEVIEMLAVHAGREQEVAAITEEAMRGELEFAESLRRRVALLEGVPATALDEVYDQIELAAGARTMVRTLKRLGYRFAMVSGGFTQITDKIAADLGIHYTAANTLEIVDGRLTGQVVGEIVDRAGKAAALRRFAAQAGIAEAATIAIGDGANDLDMLAAAGLGVAFNAKPVVRQQAQTSVSVPYIDAIMYLLGISREEVEWADAQSGIVTPAPPL